MSVSSGGGVCVQQAGSGGSYFGIFVFPNRAAGYLMIAVVGSSKEIATVSTGWTQIASYGSGSSWMRAYWRIADGSDTDRLTFTLESNGSYAAAIQCCISTVGFDANSVESYSGNVTSAAGASYALAAGVAGVSSGELAICIGGNHGSTEYDPNGCSVSGASWTALLNGGEPFGCKGGAMCSSCPTIGTPAVPSVTYEDSTHTFGKFVFAAVIKDGVPGATTNGLFFGSH